MDLEELKNIIDDQANDEGLWFFLGTESEVYLQNGLRNLHAACEKVIKSHEKELSNG